MGLLGCAGKKSNKEATVLPPPPPLYSEPLPASLASAPTPVQQSPAPAPAPTPAPAPAPAPAAAPVYVEQAQEPAPRASGRIYRIKQGDTLMKIARQEYNDASAWRKIAEANSITNPDRILVGQEIVLP
jgi:5'-nucleotidase/UDP-sugar diphosphatase